MDPALLARGFILGFTIAAAVGPISVLVIRRTLAEGRTVGLASGLGVATADATYGGIAAFGLSAITDVLVGGGRWLGLIGGVFLLWLAWRTARSEPGPAATVTERRGGLAGAYLSILGLTMTNPMTILSFGALFAGLGVTGENVVESTLITLGVFLGSALVVGDPDVGRRPAADARDPALAPDRQRRLRRRDRGLRGRGHRAGRARAVGLGVGGLLLDRPVVAVRVVEEDERVPRAARAVLTQPPCVVVLDRRDVDAARRRAPRGQAAMSLTTSCMPLTEPGRRSSPLPIVTEQAEPGGVSCTLRNSSPIRLSTSTAEAERVRIERLGAVDIRSPG